jgi:phytoene desaturase
MPDYDVIVIGAGCGGITAAALLAKQGRKTLVIEQAERVGGCCSSFKKGGYTFDVGASIVEIIEPLQRTFKELGTTLEKEIDLIPCDPIMSVIMQDGSRVTYPLSIEETGEIISGISTEDGKRWPDFVNLMRELTDVTLDTFFIMPANSMSDFLAMFKKNKKLWKFLPTFLSSYQDVLQKFFKDDRVLKTMGYQSLYFGLPPALVPGPYAMVPYSEHRGIWYPKGGMIQIPEAFRRVGEKHGMKLMLNTRVDSVMVKDGRVQGVVLEDGKEISASVVVSDINAKTLYGKMIGPEHLPGLAKRGIQSYEYSKAVPMIYVGVDYEPPLDAHHSLIGVSPEDVNQYWWNNVEPGVLPEKPMGLICWPTHTDKSLAPKGQHVLNLIPEGFYHLKDSNWDDEKEGYIERTLQYYSKIAIPGLMDHVKVVECATPLDFERRLLLPEGSIYALQQDLAAMAVFRPSSRSKVIKGLYLAGSSTHPGGGVPTTVASGLIVSNVINQYE